MAEPEIPAFFARRTHVNVPVRCWAFLSASWLGNIVICPLGIRQQFLICKDKLTLNMLSLPPPSSSYASVFYVNHIKQNVYYMCYVLTIYSGNIFGCIPKSSRNAIRSMFLKLCQRNVLLAQASHVSMARRSSICTRYTWSGGFFTI